MSSNSEFLVIGCFQVPSQLPFLHQISYIREKHAMNTRTPSPIEKRAKRPDVTAQCGPSEDFAGAKPVQSLCLETVTPRTTFLGFSKPMCTTEGPVPTPSVLGNRAKWCKRC